jgi:site-specific recombinase XerD
MRLSEILNLKWSHVDLTNRKISLVNSSTFSTKNKKDRHIPINTKLCAIISSRLPKIRTLNDEYLFTKCTGIKYNGDFISKQFKKSVRAAGLNDNIHFHSLRHSTASNLVQRGVSIYVVKELLGHEDIKTTQIYSHLKTEDLSNAVNLL